MCSFELSHDDPNYEAYTTGCDDSGAPIKYYIKQAQEMQQDEKSTLTVDYRHLSSFQYADPLFMDKLLQEYSRYEPYLRKAVTQFLLQQNYPISKGKYFMLAIYNLPQINKIRDLKTQNLGRMMSIQGTVTRTTEVKPELLIGNFTCKICSS